MSNEGKTILVIDDEQDVIDMLTLSLSKAGLKVRSATDGVAGLTKARQEQPALIVLDLMMPKMPGLEVCKLLKADPATQAIPIIMLTAKAEEIVAAWFGGRRAGLRNKRIQPAELTCGSVRFCVPAARSLAASGCHPADRVAPGSVVESLLMVAEFRDWLTM